MANFRQIGGTELRTKLTERSAEPVRSNLAERSAEPFGFGRTLGPMNQTRPCTATIITLFMAFFEKETIFFSFFPFEGNPTKLGL